MEIYSPIAQRLGISKIKVELDDLSLMYLQPDVYHKLEHDLTLGKEARENFVKEIVAEVKEKLSTTGINYTIDGRVKHFSVYIRKWLIRTRLLTRYTTFLR